MRYASAAAFRRALETRLLTLSRDDGVSLVRLRKSVAFDRLLARLFAVAPDRWDWRVPYARMAREVGLDAELDRGYELAARLLDPGLSGDLGAAAWEPAARNWVARSSQSSD